MDDIRSEFSNGELTEAGYHGAEALRSCPMGPPNAPNVGGAESWAPLQR